MDKLTALIESAKGWSGWALFGLAMIWWIRGIPERRRAMNEGDASLRDALLNRIGKLEADAATMRRECDEEQHALREELRKQREASDLKFRELYATIDGLQRQLIASQIATAQAMPLGPRSKNIEDMVDRVQGYMKHAEEGEA